jgi:hypothetical protein
MEKEGDKQGKGKESITKIFLSQRFLSISEQKKRQKPTI